MSTKSMNQNNDSVINFPVSNKESLAINMRDVSLVCQGSAIVENVNLQVRRGTIYALLGPSGCGKTSLIRCMLRVVPPTEGTVRLFGRATLPGSAFGYMPQDYTLYDDLSVSETYYYFGTLYGLPTQTVKQRQVFYNKFLSLPNADSYVRTLSGGQKRRVSLACALIHRPPLLILDEPTVGLDPVLRKNIWAYLRDISQNEHVTVLITTHYIEEASSANMVGLMRSGRILEQARPADLVRRYSVNTLEDAFLHVCCNDNRNNLPHIEVPEIMDSDLEIVASDQLFSSSSTTSSSGVSTRSNSIVSCQCEDFQEDEDAIKRGPNISKVGSFSHIFAMVYKNLKSLNRNPAHLLFQLLLPAIEVILFCTCIGRKLHSIPVAVHNGDHLSDMSWDFLKTIDPYVIHQHHYATAEDALEAVRNGSANTALVIPENFSGALIERIVDNLNSKPDLELLTTSTVQLYPDFTNQLMVYEVYTQVLDAFKNVSTKYLKMMDYSPSLLDLPVNLSTPIYGEKEQVFTEFMTPGVVLSIGFLAAIPLTAITVVVERKKGLVERTIMSGVSHFDILLSHVIAQKLLLLGQVFLVMACVFPIFGIPYNGEFFPIVALTILQSSCGMYFGLLISSLASNENSATMLALGFFYPNLLLSGTVWPTEAMYPWVRSLAYLLPQTCAIDSMRYMIIRGWGLEREEVRSGFYWSLGWMFAFLALSSIMFRYNK